MDVELLTQQGAAHGRALDVPTRATLTKRAGPLRLSRFIGLCGLPQHKVQRVVLASRHSHAFAGTQFVKRLARQLAVASELAHREIDIGVVSTVGQAPRLQPADHLQHLRHIGGRPGLVGGPLHAQGVQILVHLADHVLGQFPDGDPSLQGTADDLVVNVGDVAYVGHRQTASTQPPLHDVEGQHHPGVPHVAQVVDRHAADVHAHMAGFNGPQRLQSAGQGVVDVQAHARAVPTAPGRNIEAELTCSEPGAKTGKERVTRRAFKDHAEARSQPQNQYSGGLRIDCTAARARAPQWFCSRHSRLRNSRPPLPLIRRTSSSHAHVLRNFTRRPYPRSIAAVRHIAFGFVGAEGGAVHQRRRHHAGT